VVLLDTDHLSVFTDQRDPRHGPLSVRLEACTEQVACTVVSVEGILRGWLALINRLRDVRRQPPAYDRLMQVVKVVGDWVIVPFDELAADRFTVLRRERLRMGTMDLKIASIALVQEALLLTSNLRDFAAVPGLRCEDWLNR
jgi:tRNA(fMet)-specific endonuclease VapC